VVAFASAEEARSTKADLRLLFQPIKEFRAGRIYADPLVVFELQCLSVTVLRVLDDKDHQKRDDRCACVDDELPAIGPVKEWTGCSPHDHAQKR